MKRSKLIALVAVQTLAFFLVLSLNTELTGEEMIKGWLPLKFALWQVFIHSGLWE